MDDFLNSSAFRKFMSKNWYTLGRKFEKIVPLDDIRNEKVENRVKGEMVMDNILKSVKPTTIKKFTSKVEDVHQLENSELSSL